MQLELLSDNELISLAQNGNIEAKETVVARNKNLVKSIAHSFFLIGGDEEDLLIEGMIGVSKAVDGYDIANSQGCDFNAYANRCIRNQIIATIRKANSSKNIPLNYYISLSGLGDETGRSELVIDTLSNPESNYINKETAEELKTKIKGALSKLENDTLTMYLHGYSYREIGEKTNKNVKSVENALQRIRNKVKELI